VSGLELVVADGFIVMRRRKKKKKKTMMRMMRRRRRRRRTRMMVIMMWTRMRMSITVVLDSIPLGEVPPGAAR
jgi:hypothetical protein